MGGRQAQQRIAEMARQGQESALSTRWPAWQLCYPALPTTAHTGRARKQQRSKPTRLQSRPLCSMCLPQAHQGLAAWELHGTRPRPHRRCPQTSAPKDASSNSLLSTRKRRPPPTLQNGSQIHRHFKGLSPQACSLEASVSLHRRQETKKEKKESPSPPCRWGPSPLPL